MIPVTRLGNAWVSATDPDSQELVLIHVDSLRQEATDPINPTAVIATFSYLHQKQLEEGQAVDLDAAKKKAKAWPTEVTLLMQLQDGSNPAALFDTVASVLINVVLGTHPVMNYADYQSWLKTDPRYGKTYYAIDDESSPTGRLAVWDVTFNRRYGIDDKGLFSILSSTAKYRAGYMGGQEVFPGSIYNFPKGFYLTKSITGDNFIGILADLIKLVNNSDDLAMVEPFWVK